MSRSSRWSPLASRFSTSHQGAIGASAVALALVLGLQCERVFVPTMIFVVDQSNRIELALNAGAVFLAIALGGALARGLSPRQAALTSAVLLATCRIVVQFVDSPEMRWQVGALGLIAFGWFLIVVTTGSRDALAVGLGLGFWLDLVLRARFDTIDLPYMAGAAKDGLTVLLVALLLAAAATAALPARPEEAGWLDSLPLLGIGAGIGSYALIAGNLGLAANRTGQDLQYDLWLLSLGPVVAVALWLFPIRISAFETPRFSTTLFLAIAAGVCGLIGLIPVAEPVSGNRMNSAGLALFCFASCYLTMVSAKGRLAADRRPWLWRTAALVTLGMLVHAATVFLYFASSGSFAYAAVGFGMLAAAGVFAARRPARPETVSYGRYLAPAGVVTAAFVVALLSIDHDAPGGTVAQLDPEFTVLSYNIQNGFSRDNFWSLEATARTIERYEPDIVLLQESGRGWFAMGWADQAAWLSRRLDMEMAFGAASKDDLWGNTILSAAPILDSETVKFTSTQNLNRSVVSAIVPLADGELWVASTHLDNPGEAQEVRLEQTAQLLEAWGGAQPTIIGGDFNTEPGTDVVIAITEAGFIDTAAAAGNEETTSESGRKIDYVFVTPDFETVSVTIEEIWTSDHKPVAVVVRLKD